MTGPVVTGLHLDVGRRRGVAAPVPPSSTATHSGPSSGHSTRTSRRRRRRRATARRRWAREPGRRRRSPARGRAAPRRRSPPGSTPAATPCPAAGSASRTRTRRHRSAVVLSTWAGPARPARTTATPRRAYAVPVGASTRSPRVDRGRRRAGRRPSRRAASQREALTTAPRSTRPPSRAFPATRSAKPAPATRSRRVHVDVAAVEPERRARRQRHHEPEPAGLGGLDVRRPVEQRGPPGGRVAGVEERACRRGGRGTPGRRRSPPRRCRRRSTPPRPARRAARDRPAGAAGVGGAARGVRRRRRVEQPAQRRVGGAASRQPWTRISASTMSSPSRTASGSIQPMVGASDRRTAPSVPHAPGRSTTTASSSSVQRTTSANGSGLPSGPLATGGTGTVSGLVDDQLAAGRGRGRSRRRGRPRRRRVARSRPSPEAMPQPCRIRWWRCRSPVSTSWAALRSSAVSSWPAKNAGRSAGGRGAVVMVITSPRAVGLGCGRRAGPPSRTGRTAWCGRRRRPGPRSSLAGCRRRPGSPSAVDVGHLDGRAPAAAAAAPAGAAATTGAAGQPVRGQVHVVPPRGARAVGESAARDRAAERARWVPGGAATAGRRRRRCTCAEPVDPRQRHVEVPQPAGLARSTRGRAGLARTALAPRHRWRGHPRHPVAISGSTSSRPHRSTAQPGSDARVAADGDHRQARGHAPRAVGRHLVVRQPLRREARATSRWSRASSHAPATCRSRGSLRITTTPRCRRSGRSVPASTSWVGQIARSPHSPARRLAAQDQAVDPVDARDSWSRSWSTSLRRTARPNGHPRPLGPPVTGCRKVSTASRAAAVDGAGRRAPGGGRGWRARRPGRSRDRHEDAGAERPRRPRARARTRARAARRSGAARSTGSDGTTTTVTQPSARSPGRRGSTSGQRPGPPQAVVPGVARARRSRSAAVTARSGTAQLAHARRAAGRRGWWPGAARSASVSRSCTHRSRSARAAVRATSSAGEPGSSEATSSGRRSSVCVRRGRHGHGPGAGAARRRPGPVVHVLRRQTFAPGSSGRRTGRRRTAP